MKKKIALFEPWHFGDLIISCNFARELAENNKSLEIHYVIKPTWKQWLEKQKYISQIYTYNAPWTWKHGKYFFWNYSIPELIRLGCDLRKEKYCFVLDARGDIRHSIFLHALGLRNIISPHYPKNMNVYERYHFINDKYRFGINNLLINNIKNDNKSGYIAVFIGSAWKNRAVPIQKGLELIDALIRMGETVKLILQPEDDKYPWQTFQSNYKNRFEYIQGNLLFAEQIVLNAKACISTDSAWMHLANYHYIATIGLFGWQNADMWAPLQCDVVFSEKVLRAEERYKLKNEHVQPLSTLNIEKVLKAVERIHTKQE